MLEQQFRRHLSRLEASIYIRKIRVGNFPGKNCKKFDMKLYGDFSVRQIALDRLLLIRQSNVVSLDLDLDLH